MQITRVLSFLAIWAFVGGVFAAQLQILGLFKDKVMIEIDGDTHVLKVGESIEGIKLIRADSKECELEIDGQSQIFTLGSQISNHFTPTQRPVVRVEQDQSGLYRTSGAIDGHQVNFIIDTGASYVTININQAKALGIDFQGKQVQVETASGKAKAYLITLNKISMGAIVVYNVPALVIESDSPPAVLLGMSFLKQLEMTDKQSLLEFRQKY